MLLFPVFLIISFTSTAQLVNEGGLYISKSGLVSTYYDAHNRATGDIVNDGKIYYHKNLLNHGLITFTAKKGGNTYFIGSENQIIQTLLSTEFYNVYFENDSPQPSFQLLGDIEIENDAHFNLGIVNANATESVVKFGKNASVYKASNLSFIDGKALKENYDGFEFPIGDEKFYRSVILNTNFSRTARIDYRYQNSDIIHSHSKKGRDIYLIDNKEYWNIDQLEGEKIIVQLKTSSSTTPKEILEPQDGTAIQIIGWNENTGKWEMNPNQVVNKEGEITALIHHPGIYTFARTKIKENFPKDIVIYNGVSPNGDGNNDIFFIENLDKYPHNSIEIYNRWGSLIYETQDYGKNGKWFSGISEGNLTLNKGERVPTGTYFYVLKIKTIHGNTVDTSGYLYVN